MKMHVLPLLSLALAVSSARAQDIAPAPRPGIDVVFCLDATGSMSGLIEGAKEKIWSIANGIVSQKPTPQVRIGLLAYRDRGDEYITKRFDLTDDIDTVFANLKTFTANGGGDTPESVNQALHEAVNQMSWTKEKDALKIIFLVGDAPPHMDYQDDIQYPDTCQKAARAGIIINTVQCGTMTDTTPIWQKIARLAEGQYIALAQSGGMAAIATPFDEDIAKLSADIGGTALAYGDARQRREVAAKSVAAEAAPAAVAADRAFYNSMSGGKAVQGRGDLIGDLEDGAVSLDKLPETEMPEELKRIPAADRADYVAQKQAERQKLNEQVTELSRKRADFIEKEKQRLVQEGKGDGFDLKVNEIITEQALRNRNKK